MTVVRIERAEFDAAIFDLDGVITRTARVHAAAWQQVFDEFLRAHAVARGGKFVPFDRERDYNQYVDGKPREAGVRDFLASRGITLEEGLRGAGSAMTTVQGLGDAKNRRFLELIAEHGVEVYEHAVELVQRLRAGGFKTAIVTASRNCDAILAATGLGAAFDTQVDGNVAAAQGLAGKPAPDTFLAAARALGVSPSRAVVFEDAVAGVRAASAGSFALVVGVDRVRHSTELLAAGADLSIEDLSGVSAEASAGSPSMPLQLARHLAAVEARLSGKRPAVFLDYDGTLTPIVARPEMAILADESRQAVLRLSRLCPVAIVSGRGLDDVRRRVDIDGIAYAGSHGLEIIDAGGRAHDQPGALAAVPALDAAQRSLQESLARIPGTALERKRFALAVHFRQAAPAAQPEVERAVDSVLRAQPLLRKGHGKKVFELLPGIDWHKGTAVRWILGELGLDRSGVLPVYLGDDVTDEDAFGAIAGDGLGIVIMDPVRPSAARYRVRDTDAAREFLEWLARRLERAR